VASPPYSAEICAGAGFHWLRLDSEHSLLLSQLRAIAAYPIEPVVRAAICEMTLIKQALNIGARSLLIPMVDSAQQAAQLVKATRYPPHGVRGVGFAIGRPVDGTARPNNG